MNIKYRPEIDGLRAIAVLAVVFFHTNFLIFKGGFIGVDIFFVISGYLITNLIINELEAGKFSIFTFFENRAKRLLPGLFFLLVTLFSLGFAFFDYLTFKNLGKEVFACVFYFSNLLYWKEVGYFDITPIQKPLLHTWSLSVEEQFYLFFPLLLSFIFNWVSSKRLIEKVLFFLLLTSFFINVLLVEHYPSATFYLLPTRAWEFFCGSITYFISIKLYSTKFYYKNILFSVGVILITFSVFYFSKSNAFPGFFALIPVFGTVLIILFGNQSNFILVDFLKSKILLLVGKMSYSIYLWHWPIYVIYKYILIDDLKFRDFIILFILIFFFSYISYKYVEKPFRYYHCKNRYKIISIFILLSIFISGIGLVINRTDGIPSRSKYNKIMTNAFLDPFWDSINSNEIKFIQNNSYKPFLLGKIDIEPNYILWGDSHARALAYGLNQFSLNNNISGFVFSQSSSPPIFDFNISNPYNIDMYKFNNYVKNFIIKNKKIKNIIICSRWGYYTNEPDLKYEIKESIAYKSKNVKSVNFDNNLKRDFYLQLKKTVDTLLSYGKKIYIISPVPELSADVRNVMGNQNFYKLFNISFKSVIQKPLNYNKRNQSFFYFVNSFPKTNKLNILNLQDIFFNSKIDNIVVSGQLIYRDNNHLSKYGSLYVKSIFNSILF